VQRAPRPLLPQLRLQPLNAQRGTTEARPTRTATLPDGGTTTEYRIGGEVHSVPIPPVDFDPLTATEAGLERYGLPPRPAVGPERDDWLATMTNWERNPDPGLCLTDLWTSSMSPIDSASGGQTPGYAGAAFNTYNWAGYTTDLAVHAYIAVQGDFYHPTKYATACSGPTAASWTGLGGMNSESLIQTGTAILANDAQVAWYEYLGPGDAGIPLTVMSGVSVAHGHRIHTYVVHQTSTGLTTFYVANNTNGQSKSVIVDLDTGTYYDGASTDFNDERLTYSGSFTPLVRFLQIDWWNTKVQKTSGAWYTLGCQAEKDVKMVNVAGQTMAYPNAMSSTTTFRDNWVRCN